MLVSQLIKCTISLRPLLLFSNAPTFSTIFNKATGTKNLAEFARLVQQNKREFTGEIYASVSKHLSGLIFTTQRKDINDAKTLFNELKALSISNLSLHNIVGIMCILRAFSSMHIYSIPMREELVKTFMILLREKESTKRDLSNLVNGYLQLTNLRRRSESKQVAERILKLLQYKKESRTLSDFDYVTLMQGIASKSDLSHTEIRMRSQLLREVNNYLDSIKIQELVRMVAYLNSMDLFQLNGTDFKIIKKIVDRIIVRLTDLEERKIYQFLRVKNVGTAPTVYRLYNDLFRGIISEINDQGESEINQESIFKMLGLLSDKISLYKASLPEQKKLFVWLQKFARKCKAEKKDKLLSGKLMKIISNNFFSEPQKAKIISIFHDNSLGLHITTLYELAIKDYDLQPIANSILDHPIDQMQGTFLIQLGVAAHKLALQAGSPEATAKSNAFKMKLAEELTTPQKFVTFYYQILQRNNVDLSIFHSAFGELVEQLPCPLSEISNVQGYRRTYLKYFHKALLGQRFNQFFQNAAITWQEQGELLRNHIFGDPRDIKPKRHIVFYLARRVREIIDSKDKPAVSGLIDFINKYNRFVVGGHLDIGCINALFKILHTLIAKVEVVEKLDLGAFFFASLEKYLTRNYKNYNLQIYFRDLIKHLLDQIPKLSKTKIIKSIIREGLRLSMITQSHLKEIKIEDLNFSFIEKAKLHYIKDNSYQQIKLNKITASTLEIIFSNHNLESLLQQQEKNVMQTLQTCTIFNLATYLTIFNHQSPASRRVLNEILNKTVAKLNNLDGIDVIRIFQNALQRGYYFLTQYKRIADKVAENYEENIARYSLEEHLELIKFTCSQSYVKRGDYYNKLVAWVEKREDNSDYSLEQLLLRLLNTDYKFRPEDLAHLPNIIKRNANSGLYFFVMVENLLEKQARIKAAKQIAAVLLEKKGKINKLYYKYIKKKYPQETAAVNLDENDLLDENVLVKNRHQETINTIVKLSGGVLEEVTELGTNYLFKIKNYVFGFIGTWRQGAYYEQAFLKNAVSVLRGEPLTTVILYLGYSTATILEYIHKNCPNFFNEEEYNKTIEEWNLKSIRQRQLGKK